MLVETKDKIRVYFFSIVLCYLLTSCSGTYRQHTTIYDDNSGEVTFEIGYTDEENKELTVNGKKTIASVDDCKAWISIGELPEIRVTFEKREEKTWCGYSQSFDNLETLNSFYKEYFDLEAIVLVKKDGKIIYNVPNHNTDNPSDETGGTWVNTWALTLPGEILENNADKIIGNTLIWELNHPIDTFYAESLVKEKEKWSLGNYLANNIIVVMAGFIASLISIWTFLRERK